jgi:hypothetical protein
VTAPLSFLLDGADAHERLARLREMRAVTAMICGWQHPVKRALDEAINGSGSAVAIALAEIDALPALRRRRVLAVIAALGKGGGR